MSKIIIYIATTSTILSIFILLAGLVISKNVISKIIILSVIISAFLISTTLMQFGNNTKYAYAFVIIYAISQFTIILHALHLIKNEE